MFSFLFRTMEPEKRQLMDFMMVLFEKLDANQRREAADYCEIILRDGKIGLTEWSQFGKKVGAFRLGK
jgi:aspartate/methionine/tyrosine aminotransferase